MGFNSAFKGLMWDIHYSLSLHSYWDETKLHC